MTAMFELTVLLDLESAHLIDRFVEELDHMKAIMDQRRVRKQFFDTRNVGLLHIGRNGLDLVLYIPQKDRVTGLVRYFFRVPVPHQGRRPVRNHSRPLRTYGPDESPSHPHAHTKCLGARVSATHGPHCGAGFDSPHQTCN